MWTSGDVKAAIDRELVKLERTKIHELPGLLERVRRIGSEHGHPQLAEEAVGRVRSMLPADLMTPQTPRTPYRSSGREPEAPPVGLLRKCDACKFEWRAADEKEGCPLCRLHVVENKVKSFGVLNDDEQWIGKLVHALGGTGKLAHAAGDPLRCGLLGYDQQIDGGDRFAAIDVVVRPQTLFQPLLLIVAPECEDGALIDIKVGNRSQLRNFTPIALSLYRPSSWADVAAMKEALLVECDMACVAQDVTLTVALARRGRFRAALLGCIEERARPGTGYAPAPPYAGHPAYGPGQPHHPYYGRASLLGVGPGFGRFGPPR